MLSIRKDIHWPLHNCIVLKRHLDGTRTYYRKTTSFLSILVLFFFVFKKMNAEVNAENPSDQLETVKNLYREYFTIITWIPVEMTEYFKNVLNSKHSFLASLVTAFFIFFLLYLLFQFVIFFLPSFLLIPPYSPTYRLPYFLLPC